MSKDLTHTPHMYRVAVHSSVDFFGDNWALVFVMNITAEVNSFCGFCREWSLLITSLRGSLWAVCLVLVVCGLPSWVKESARKWFCLVNKYCHTGEKETNIAHWRLFSNSQVLDFMTLLLFLNVEKKRSMIPLLLSPFSWIAGINPRFWHLNSTLSLSYVN